MKIKLYILFLLILLISSGCASQQDMDALKWELDMLQTRLAKTEQGISDMAKAPPKNERDQKESLQKPSDLSSPEKDRRLDQVMKQQADLNAQYTELYTQIFSLQGKIDEIDSMYSTKQNELIRQQSDLNTQYSDLSNQIFEIQKRLDELDTLYNKLSTSTENDKLNLMMDEINTIKSHLNIEEEKTNSLYELGLKNFEKRKFEKAISNFAEFLNGNPQQSLIDNAHFWIGESLFNLGKFEDAILEYDIVLKNFKDSEKIPDCLLKQGRAFIKLKDDQTGKIILQRLVNEYPESVAASKANAILK